MKKSQAHRRPLSWTVILIPSKPGASAKQLTIRARSIAGFGLVIALLIGAIATWTGETQNIAEATASELAESRRTVVSLLDSVTLLGALATRAKYLPPKDMILPVAGRISSGFSNSRLNPILEIFRAHRGVDLSAPLGTRIVAPADGRVIFVGRRIGYGLVVELKHSGEIVTRYGHCRSVLVRAGQRVASRQVIATVGTSGLSTGPHVHFEVLNRGKSVDPIRFLASTRIPTLALPVSAPPIRASGRPMGL